MYRNSKREVFGEEHMTFLQGIMTKGIMNTSQVQELFRMSCNHYDGKNSIIIYTQL
jgi:hypothetical protein